MDYKTMFDVTGQVCVVTGGGSGIGQYCAAALAANGAIVYIIGRREEKLKETAEKYGEGRIFTLVGDVTSKEDLARCAATVEKERGFINLLVANSGILGPMQGPPPAEGEDIKTVQKKLWDIDPKVWDDVFSTNVYAVYYSTVAFLALLHAGNEHSANGSTSSVLAVTSVAGFNKNINKFTGFPYHTSKAAENHLAKSLANFLGPMKIRVNVLAPGPFPSEMMRVDVRSAQGVLKPVSSMGRVGTPEEIASFALMMTSRAGGFLTGGVYLSDGGRTLAIPASY